MYLVIGKENCSSCEVTKTIFKNKGIEYEYVLLDELQDEDKKKYMKMAREQGRLSMPLIIKKDKIFSLQEVIR
jgi:glutaredoxin